jgi:hypothetical protein
MSLLNRYENTPRPRHHKHAIAITAVIALLALPLTILLPGGLAGATEPPITCTWGVTGLTSPTSGDTLAQSGNDSTPIYFDGITDLWGSCTGLADNYSEIMTMQNADGGVELLTLIDDDNNWGTDGDFANFATDPSWDLNNGTLYDSTDANPTALDEVQLLWFDNATDAETWADEPGLAIGAAAVFTTNYDTDDNATATDTYDTDAPDDSGSTTTTTTSTTTTTLDPAVQIANAASSESGGIIDVAGGMTILAIVSICVKYVFVFFKSR